MRQIGKVVTVMPESSLALGSRKSQGREIFPEGIDIMGKSSLRL